MSVSVGVSMWVYEGVCVVGVFGCVWCVCARVLVKHLKSDRLRP